MNHKKELMIELQDTEWEYESRANTKPGKLVANRELPILHHAKEILNQNQ